MKFYNLTPHDIEIVAASGVSVSIPASGVLARVSVNRAHAFDVDGIGVFSNKVGAVTNLPDSDGRVFIVSRAVASAVPNRADVVFPDDMIRAENGRIIGCRSFGYFSD